MKLLSCEAKQVAQGTGKAEPKKNDLREEFKSIFTVCLQLTEGTY